MPFIRQSSAAAMFVARRWWNDENWSRRLRLCHAIQGWCHATEYVKTFDVYL